MSHPALRDVELSSYWLDDPAAPAPAERLSGHVDADLAVVGGGYTGLWTALLAKEANPALRVVVLEGARVGWAASGRNGGFCAASLTHGLGNGLARFPDEMPALQRLGRENLQAIEETVRRYDIDCDFERSGELSVATRPHEVGWLAEDAANARRFGQRVELLDAEQARQEVASPTYLAALWHRDSTAMLNPARLAWGLQQACLSLGVRVFERSPVTAVTGERAGVRLSTRGGAVVARNVALGTNAFPPLLRRVRPYVVPVYDYALMTEPLTAAQRESIGWRNRQGVGDSGNQFHYYRITADNRVLFGGYDAVYHYGNALHADLDRRPETFALLASHFFETFPQLAGVRFTHAWGGAIDTCSRFSAFFGTALRGRVAYAAGYTGLGVGATRFGARVMLDLLAGRDSELTRLAMVRRKPVPFPPEPLRYGVIQLTRWSMSRADRHGGRRNGWLRVLDRLGLGFDS
jgi:glycine/D-amino acid oxidase-like deaminating enzyme